MKDTIFTKDQINTAILKVLTHQYKKDAKEYHIIVKKAGYEIEKWNGSFEVKNPETHRYVKVNFTYNDRGYLYKQSGSKRFNGIAELKPVDFVGQLETTRKPYCEPCETESEAYLKHRGIKNADYWAESADKHIKETLEKLSSLQKDLIYYTEEKAKYEAKAKSLRKEYGLI